MKKSLLTIFSALVGIGILFGGIPMIYAQETEEETAAEEFTLEEVTVTAEKRQENLQAVPRSMAVITADEIQLRSATEVYDILSDEAGITFNAGGPWLNHLGVRGMLPNTSEGGSEPSVQFNIDGNTALAYEGQGQIPVMYMAMMDTERIEVVRGPSGAVSGRMAGAGSVNVVTTDPSFEEFEGYIDYTTGNYNTHKHQGAFGVPLKATGLDLPPFLENLAFRFAFIEDVHDYYIQNSDDQGVSGNKDYFGTRGKMKWEVTEDVLVSAMLSYQRDRSNTGMTVPSIEKPITWQPFPGPLPETHADDPWLNASGNPASEEAEDIQWSRSLQVDWSTRLGTVTAKYAKTYTPVDCSNRAAPMGPPGAPATPTVCYEGNIGQDQYELRMVSPDDSKIRWYGGINKFHKIEYTGPDQPVDEIDPDAVSITFSDFFGSIDYFDQAGYDITVPTFDANNLDHPWALTGLVAPTTEDSAIFFVNSQPRPIDSYSAYGNVTVPVFSERHRFTLGLRYTKEEKKREATVAVYGADEFGTNQGLPHFTYDADMEQWVCDNCYEAYVDPPSTWNTDTGELDYTFGWDYDWTEDVLLYANINTGFKPGGISPNAVPITKYDAEKYTNYAVGMNSHWFDNTVMLNAELYAMNIDGQNLNFASEGELRYTLGGVEYVQPYKFQSRSTNLGPTTNYGLEVDYDWLITNRDRLHGTAAYTHAKYGAFEMNRGLNVNPPGGAQYISYKGRQVANAPEYKLSANYSHRFTIRNLMITPRIRGSYASKQYVNSEYWWEPVTPEIWQPAYTKWDGYLNIAPQSGKWQLNAYVKNATETIIRNLAMAFMGVNIEAPRTYGVGLRVNF